MSEAAVLPSPTMPGRPIRIDPDGWYTDADLRLLLGMPGTTLNRARRSKALRFTRLGNVRWHRGQWVESWLSGRKAVAHAR